VLVKYTYSGLNFIDTYYREGLYKQDLPFVSGQEGGGVIEDIHTAGDSTDTKTSSSLNVGDRVAYMSFGSLAEYTVCNADKVVKVPPELDLETAVACMVQGLTAHYLVTDATAGLIAPGDWCLIYSVGSGTCQWAAQMAKLRGFNVIGTASKTKAAAAKGICDELIVLETAPGKTFADYESVDIAKRVMEITNGTGVKMILDGVGKSP
jgi:NADPH2:quinone reductase